MKKTYTSILLVLFCINCLHSIEFKAGQIAKEKIIIDDKAFEKTAEVYVIDSTKVGKDITVIKGEKPSFVESDFWSEQGVFIPGRTVKLTPFIMSKYPVTQELYYEVMKDQQAFIGLFSNNLDSKPFRCSNYDKYPIQLEEIQKYRPAENITWYDAVFFCNALTEKTMSPDDKAYTIKVKSVSSDGHIKDALVTLDISKKGYRLPTEAEWEFAARGGKPENEEWTYCYSGAPKGDSSFEGFSSLEIPITEWGAVDSNLNKLGWYNFVFLNTEDGSSKGYIECGTHEVGLKSPNSLGIYDMNGNVSEWCFDGLEENLKKNEVINPIGDLDSDLKIYRGGNWHDTLDYISVSWRGWGNEPNKSFTNIGFRLVRTASE